MKDLAVLAALAVVVLSIPGGCRYLESPSQYFEDHSDALYDGMWVPKIFPPDIREIHEQHNVDSNEVWVRFRAGPAGFTPASHGFVEVAPSELQDYRASRPFLVRWWFSAGGNDSAKLYKGSCYPESDADGRVAFVREEGPYVFWWCRYT